MKGYALGGLLRAREARERQALLVAGAKAEALARADGLWQAARKAAADIRSGLRDREAERFRALGDGAPAGDWRRAREEIRGMQEALALLEAEAERALRAREAAEAAHAEAKAALMGRMRERMKLDAHRGRWSEEAARSRDAAEEAEAET